MNRAWYTCTMEYYSVFQRKDVLTQPPVWMNLEDMMLNERNHTLKDRYCVIPIL